ncbi:MAG TPA: hypothetical protein VM689_12275 [Aliidongia sp.]|nr:hypothetical protein [Aliidongia sp.]
MAIEIPTSWGMVQLPVECRSDPGRNRFLILGFLVLLAMSTFAAASPDNKSQIFRIVMGIGAVFFGMLLVVAIRGTATAILSEDGILFRLLGREFGFFSWADIARIRIEYMVDMENRGIGFRQLTNPYLIERLVLVQLPRGRGYRKGWYFNESEDYFEVARSVINYFAKLHNIPIVTGQRGEKSIQAIEKGAYASKLGEQEWGSD